MELDGGQDSPGDEPLGGPSGSVADTSAAFGFTSNEQATFTCILDGGAALSCGSPKAYTGLSDGEHTFRVFARDVAGNVDPSPATRTWTVDTTAPDTTLAGGPAALTNQTTASFTVGSTESGSTYACKLDGATKPCDDVHTVTAGEHTFTATATDAAGNTDPTPASHTWTVDTAAPDTTLSGGPSTLTNQTTASFTVGSTESGSTYACQLDGATRPCDDVHTVTAGEHTFTATATDAAGNTDPTPASHTWTVDTAAPETTITSGPLSLTRNDTASFAFQAEAGATFSCTLDGIPTSCAGPYVVQDGDHTFAVAARDQAGNSDPTPATWDWTVDTTAPTVTSWKPRGNRVSRKAKPSVVFTEAMVESSVEAARRGKPLAFQLTLKGKKVAAKVSYRETRTGAFRAVLTPERPLKPRARYKATVSSRATDLAGNALVTRSWQFRTRR